MDGFYFDWEGEKNCLIQQKQDPNSAPRFLNRSSCALKVAERLFLEGKVDCLHLLL